MNSSLPWNVNVFTESVPGCDAVRKWLGEHNWIAAPDFMRKMHDPAHQEQSLVLLAQGESGEVVGGLIAATQLKWLKISVMAVAPEHRSRGVGSALLAEAECQAAGRGCEMAYVDSMEHQAPRFYLARGFILAGELPDWDSHGHAKQFFTKPLFRERKEEVVGEADTLEGVRIVEANLNQAVHRDHVLQLVDGYSMDPMGDGKPLADSSRRDLISGLRNHPTTMILMAVKGEEPVGMALCFRGFSTFAARPLMNIHDFYVKRSLRGTGLGRRLMSAVEDRARELGCCKLTLEVQQDNARARNFYAAFGFNRDVHTADAGAAYFLTKPL